MTDQLLTERLRELLDELGVEWMDDSYAQLWCTVWNGHDGKQWRMTENYSGMLTELKAWHVTPEQAIAATLGGGKLTAEQVRTSIESRFDFDVWVPNERWQAIADELNAALGGGECEMKPIPFMGWKCSKCGKVGMVYGDTGREMPRFCPNCGKAVER